MCHISLCTLFYTKLFVALLSLIYYILRIFSNLFKLSDTLVCAHHYTFESLLIAKQQIVMQIVVFIIVVVTFELMVGRN